MHELSDAAQTKHRKLTHCWILWAFEGPPPGDRPYVCHRDGNPDNNRLDNLYYGTSAENARDRTRHGRSGAQLPDAVVHSIINQRAAGVSVTDIAAHHEVPAKKVRRILTGANYSAITGLEHEPTGPLRGEHHGNAKLTEPDVLEIVKQLNQGETQRAIADRFGVDNVTINSIKCGRLWGHLTGIPYQKPGCPKGEDHSNAKLTADKVCEICKLAQNGWSQVDIALKFGVSKSNISAILRGRSWSQLTGIAPKSSGVVRSLTPGKVREIRKLARSEWRQSDIAHEFGVHRVTISKILLGKTWKRVED